MKDVVAIDSFGRHATTAIVEVDFIFEESSGPTVNITGFRIDI